MIDKMWEILTTFTEESQNAALSKCAELGFEPNRGDISLDESYINLNSAGNILKDAIEQRKLIQLPITIQKDLIASLEEIAKFQENLMAGRDEVINLSNSIEKLNVYIWQYGLHNLSDEVLGYQTKLNQLKNLEIKALKTQKTLEEGISVKKNLELLLDEASQQSESLKTIVKSANSSFDSIKEKHSQAVDSSQKASASLAIVQQNETTSTQLLASSTKSNADILVFEKNINELISGFTSLKDELEDNKNTQKKLFEEFEAYRDKIDGLLGDANRTGMAASFTERKNDLNVPIVVWLVLFSISIIGLVGIGIKYLVPLLESGKLEQIPFRLSLTAPFIWLGWFSAKQYGYTSRLREDYAYKEASAKAFEGYKRETSQSNPELLKNLLETTIKNLGDNPIRIYSGHENHASPLNEILEKLLKDKKIIDVIKEIIISKGKE